MADWDSENDDKSFARSRTESNSSRTFQHSVGDLLNPKTRFNSNGQDSKKSTFPKQEHDWSDEDKDVRNTDSNNNSSMFFKDDRSSMVNRENRSTNFDRNRSSMVDGENLATNRVVNGSSMPSNGNRSTNFEEENVFNRSIKDMKLDDHQENKDDIKKSKITSHLDRFTKMIRNKVINSTQDIEISRNNPNSPLYSVKKFEDLHLPSEILKGIYEMNYQKPSKIQETILPIIMAQPYMNAIAQSQSGTGKTAAFLIACLRRVNAEIHAPQVLIISPTLELALQIADVARQMSKFTNIKVRNIVKGELKPRNPIDDHVLVGTPGKLVDWILRGDPAFDIQKINMFILDEADVMIGIQGFREQTIKIQQRLREDTQILLFSATYTENLLQFADSIIHNPVTLTLPREDITVENINQFYVPCSNKEEKYIALANIFGNVPIGQTIVFLATRESANFLKEKLENDGHRIALLTGELETAERLAIIKRFRDGDERVLITTNLVSRGIDIEQVTLVINYDLPYNVFNKEVDYETYLHRIGRCGRFARPGFAVSLVDTNSKFDLDNIKKIEEYFSHPIKLLDTENEEHFREWE